MARQSRRMYRSPHLTLIFLVAIALRAATAQSTLSYDGKFLILRNAAGNGGGSLPPNTTGLEGIRLALDSLPYGYEEPGRETNLGTLGGIPEGPPLYGGVELTVFMAEAQYTSPDRLFPDDEATRWIEAGKRGYLWIVLADDDRENVTAPLLSRLGISYGDSLSATAGPSLVDVTNPHPITQSVCSASNCTYGVTKGRDLLFNTSGLAPEVGDLAYEVGLQTVAGRTLVLVGDFCPNRTTGGGGSNGGCRFVVTNSDIWYDYQPGECANRCFLRPENRTDYSNFDFITATFDYMTEHRVCNSRTTGIERSLFQYGGFCDPATNSSILIEGDVASTGSIGLAIARTLPTTITGSLVSGAAGKRRGKGKLRGADDAVLTLVVEESTSNTTFPLVVEGCISTSTLSLAITPLETEGFPTINVVQAGCSNQQYPPVDDILVELDPEVNYNECREGRARVEGLAILVDTYDACNTNGGDGEDKTGVIAGVTITMFLLTVVCCCSIAIVAFVVIAIVATTTTATAYYNRRKLFRTFQNAKDGGVL